MTRALWILIQKQSCSSCVIFTGSTFSRRCIRDLHYNKQAPRPEQLCHQSKDKLHWFLLLRFAYLIVSSIFDAYSNVSASTRILGTTTIITPGLCSPLSFSTPHGRGLQLSKLLHRDRGLQLSFRRLGEKVLQDETEGLGEATQHSPSAPESLQ
jgi:hypothetical protein